MMIFLLALHNFIKAGSIDKFPASRIASLAGVKLLVSSVTAMPTWL